jgi:hypothetical protein
MKIWVSDPDPALKVNTDPDPGIREQKKCKILRLKIFLILKIEIFFSLCLCEGRHSYRKRPIQHFKFLRFFLF